MNLIITSLTTIGAISVVYSIAYALSCDHSKPLWARALAILLMLGGYVGVVALIMFFLRIPLA